jgi:hypothetical protein
MMNSYMQGLQCVSLTTKVVKERDGNCNHKPTKVIDDIKRIVVVLEY